MKDYTLVVGVDDKHLKQLHMTYPTWIKHKPSLLKQPMVIFYDQAQVRESQIKIRHPHMTLVSWPAEKSTVYPGDDSKWYDAQRYKMLAGFVHVPAMTVGTSYWLKLDTDVVATGQDSWIDPSWFKGAPGIVAHRWGFTKPANQMELLDEWVSQNQGRMVILELNEALALSPEENADRLRHERIISWCGFFNTTMTRIASDYAQDTCGKGMLPVPSQDGYLWYFTTRCKHQVVRANMKALGWEHWNTMHNIGKAVERSLHGHG